MRPSPAALSPGRGGARSLVAQTQLILELALWRWGGIWALAVLLLMVAGGVALAARLVIGHDVAKLQQERLKLEHLRQAARQPVASDREANARSEGSRQSNEEKRMALESVLAPREQVSVQVRHIYKLAKQQHVEIAKADFRSDAEGESLERVQMVIPAKAAYPQLRRFLETVLRDLPNASLDRLSFKRNQVGDTEIESRVHLSLWLRSSSGEAGDRVIVARPGVGQSR